MQPSRNRPDPPFSNHFSIGYNEEEFVIQFGLMYEGQLSPSVHTTVITTPGYARKLLSLLSESLAEYERRHDPEADPPGRV